MSVNGNWQLVVDSPIGKQDVVVDFVESGGELTGTLLNRTSNVSSEIFDGSIDGDGLTWKI